MLSACTDVWLYFMNTNEILLLVSIGALSDSRRLCDGIETVRTPYKILKHILLTFRAI